MVVKGAKYKAVEPFKGIVNVGDVCIVIEIKDDVVGFKLLNNDNEESYIESFYRMNVEAFNYHFEECSNNCVSKNVDEVIANHVDKILDESEIIVDTIFDTCTIVAVCLPNGSVFTESCSCSDANEYDEDDGFKYCMNRIVNKVWEFEEYRLKMNAYICRVENASDFNCEDCDCDSFCHGCGSCGHED